MRSYILAAILAAAASATPLSAILPRQGVCVPPTVNADGTTGPFKIQVGDGSAFAGNYAGTIPQRVNYIVFQYSDPDSTRVADFYLTGSNNLIMVDSNTGAVQYAYNQIPPRYISLSPDAGVAGKVTCSINTATCELNCMTRNRQQTDCLGSPKVSPEWRIGNPAVVKPGCPAFTPVVVAQTTATESDSIINLNIDI